MTQFFWTAFGQADFSLPTGNIRITHGKKSLSAKLSHLQRHPELYKKLCQWEPSTYRLIVDGGFYRLEPFGIYLYEKILGTGDNQVKTLLRYSRMEEHRRVNVG